MPETGSRWPDWLIDRWRTLPPWRLAAASALLGLVVAVGAVAAAGPWDSGQRTAERARARAGETRGGEHHGRPDGAGARDQDPTGGPSAPGDLPGGGVLAALGAGGRPADSPGAVPAPTRAGLADALTPLLKDPALPALTGASVVDVASGRQVYGSKADTPAVPASTIKIATVVAALDALGPDHRLETRVVAGSGAREIVLVGGGDPTLTARAPKKSVAGFPPPANLRKLADDTVRALERRGSRTVRLAYDTSRYSGPTRHPIGPNENIAPVSALMIDEGRIDGGKSDSGPAERSADPAEHAAQTFAGLLRDRGIEVRGTPRAGTARKGAERLATARSMPLSALAERALTHSDNDIAEALARETAVAEGRPASFAGAGKAVRARLAGLGLPLSGVRLADGSGLDRRDKASAAFLAQLLVRASDPDRPQLRAAVTGLPVAGFSGTLRSRYREPSAGTGMVRAKTGTLTGVNTLAGTVVDADGRLLAFAFMANGTTDPQQAQAALDRLASATANCGCR
ncbi:D-alanyl-D-alanine carboxypeptidase/D-alanyl-D-alanine endopeptidase [Streptomyces sp. TP-A0874]|uniref:D-alanyl-D-alanine carboxypeptidase/D-alanyl-D-alanine endopeptidase n=1 Tax=Streptomyces sp. TP-A0874 TaxID=549819 RepID=UPI000A98759E|nr:D-alanyl-D-alanine carboxypeptidase/D-alanyl-D-alanine-endopeptidase [Streptomyces sp. TP-A0874]